VTALRQAAEDYLTLRRSLGFKLKGHGVLVSQFAGWLDDRGDTHVRTERAAEWAVLPAGATPYWHWRRLNAVRGFAAYLHGLDPGHQVPPADLLPRSYWRPAPYLLSDADISALAGAAAALTHSALHAATYQHLIGLLGVTGLRTSEAINLDVADVGLTTGVVTVHGKHGKVRHVLLHPGSITALAGYAQLRDQMFPHRAGESFFVSTVGTRLLICQVDAIFKRLAAQAGLLPRSARCRATPMSLRHSFAVNTLISWYRSGADVDAMLPLLSTWMGHVHPDDTYWYLSAAPELLALAAERMTPVCQDREAL
jgi:integrase/recombinase XerD